MSRRTCAVTAAQLLLILTGCTKYPESVRVAHVEGDPRRYSLRELEGFPPAAESVHSSAECEQVTPSFYGPKPLDSIILQTVCERSESRDRSRDRCYRFTIDGVMPEPVPCEMENDFDGYIVPMYGDFNHRDNRHPDRHPLPQAQLEADIWDESIPGTPWLMFQGVKGPYASHIEIFDTRERKRIFSLTTKKGLWTLSCVWFTVGKRTRMVALLSHTDTVVIDIHPAPGE